MANILDIRRRIRSVINTRQITKAMKMVSAAKLRRAQERALAARPYAQMLTNVLKSLVARAEIYDPARGAFSETDWKLQPMFVDTNPFLFCGKVCGAMVRLSATPIVNVTSGGGETGFFVLQEQRAP